VQLVLFEGCTIAQAASRLHFTTKTRFRPHPNPCEICGGQSGNGRDFTPSTFPLRIITLSSYYYFKFISISILWIPIIRVHFRPSRCALVKVISMLDTEFRWSCSLLYVKQQTKDDTDRRSAPQKRAWLCKNDRNFKGRPVV